MALEAGLEFIGSRRLVVLIRALHAAARIRLRRFTVALTRWVDRHIVAVDFRWRLRSRTIAVAAAWGISRRCASAALLVGVGAPLHQGKAISVKRLPAAQARADRLLRVLSPREWLLPRLRPVGRRALRAKHGRRRRWLGRGVPSGHSRPRGR